MKLSFRDVLHGGELFLYSGEKQLLGNPLVPKTARNYQSLAINTNLPTTIYLNGECISYPPYAILQVMFSQVYLFKEAEDIILWQFNRGFYCIEDHDEQGGCAGILFYGS